MGDNNTTKSIKIIELPLRSSTERNVYDLMSLATVNQLHGFNWTEMPINDYIIGGVEYMARSDNKPIITNGYPIFEWASGGHILDNGEYENKIANTVEQVAYTLHKETDDKDDEDDEYDKDTDKYNKIDGRDEKDDNKDPEETRGKPDHK